jgi:replicative DNA helicase
MHEPLALDMSVPTPTGWTTMGDIRVGDQVIGRDGRPANVLAVGPVHSGRSCYRITCKTGESIVAGGYGHQATRPPPSPAGRHGGIAAHRALP